MKRVLLLLTLCLAMLSSIDLKATHLMGADLTYTIVGPHLYTVRLSVYRDCNSTVVQPTSYRIFYQSVACNDTGSFLVNVASGYPLNVTDTCASQHSTCDGGTVYGVQQWVYTSATISLPANCPDVVMSWASGNRNGVISNLNTPLNDALYINAEVNTSLIDNSPQFLNPLTVNLCLNQLNYVNQGGYDSNGDSLVYALDYAQGTTGGGGGGYPYTPTNLIYNTGYTPTRPITSSTFSFDPATGQITVFPTQSEYDVVKLIVYEYRGGVLIGHVERDMQVEVANCTDTLPNLSGVGSINSTDTVYTLSACSRGCFTVYSTATDTNKILTLTVTGQSAFPGATFTISSGKNPSLTFCWDPSRANAGTYTFFVTVKDNACPQPGQNVRGYKIIIPQVYPAGNDQTICQYTTVTTQASGTGTWSAVSGNPTTTTIANPTSPTTLISGFVLPGRYNYQWITDTTCIDTMSIFVTSKPNAGPDITVCQFTTATMAATGSGTWTALATNPTATTINSPFVATTTITGFTVVGTYKYVWTSAGCTDTASVIVTLKPNAGPDQSICASSGVVTMAATGTGTWTAAATNPSTTVITTPASPTTTITGLLTAGTYTFYWTNGCADTVNINVTNRPNGGPDQATCQFSSVTMAATGTGTWTAQAGNPGTATIVTPTSPTTVISGFTAAGTYYYIWSGGVGCNDTAAVVVTAKPNAGPDQSTCLNSIVTMAATGAGTWTASLSNPATTIITATTSPTTTVSGFTATGTYIFYWTAGGCSDTMQVIINPQPNAGPDQTICQYTSTTLAAIGTGAWTASASNPSLVTFVNATSPATSVSGFTQAGTYILTWSSLGCSDTVLINVTAKPNAGPDQTICQYTPATMSATGTGTWTALSNNPATTVITSAGAPGTTITGFTLAGTYGFVWTSNGCTDTANVIVTAKPNAGSDQTTCQYSTATLAATGTGTWIALATNPAATTITTPASPTATISGLILPGTYSYIWTSNGCTDTANVIVTPKPNAGPDQTICQYSSTTLAATGTGTWTASAGNPSLVTFVTPTSPTTSVSGFTGVGIYTLFWSLNGCSDTVLITVTAKPNAGSDQTICQYATTSMAATGTGTWTISASNPATTVLTSLISPTTAVSGFIAAGTYSYIWSQNGCSDTVNINVTAKPNAGADQSFCLPGIITISATSGPGVWTALPTNAASTIVSPNSISTVVNGFTTGGYYSYIWTVNGCTDTTVVTAFPTSPAGPDQTVCQYNSVTTAAFGNGTWIALSTNPNPTTIANTTADTTTITGFNLPGVYGFIWSVSPCTDTMYVTVNAKPDAGPDQTVCQYSTAIMAATGTGVWTAIASNPATTTITTASSPSTTITGFTLAGTYSYVWTSGGCTDTVNIIVTAKPNAGPDQTTCQYSTAAMAAIGTGTWTALGTNPALTIITTLTSPTTTISGFTVAGTYSYIWTSNGCTDTANVIVTAKPDAGADQSTCQYSTADMAATGTGIWTILSGNPATTIIAIPTSPTTSISGFTIAGTYGYIWSSNGCSDTANVVVTAKPNAGTDQTTCQYSTATMAATGTGTWAAIPSNPAATVIANATSPNTSISGFTVAGTYGYIWTSNSCSDTANVIVTAKPNAGADQTTCQFSTVSMAASGAGLWSTPTGNPAAPVIANTASPTTLISGLSIAGTYIYIWSSNGCSDTANVIVTAKPNAGADQSTCQYSTATMAAAGTGTWTAVAGNPGATTIATPVSPTTSISGFPIAGTYGYIWTSNGCSDTANVIVTAKPNAGADQTTCQYSTATMAASGTGTWSAIATNPATTIIAAATSPGTSISGFSVAGTYSYVWTSNGCSDTANVNVTSKPDAGPDQGFCLPGSVIITASAGPGIWTALPSNPGSSTIASPNNISTAINGISLGGYYNYVWTSNGCTDTTTVTAYPTSPAGPDQTICQHDSILTSAFGHGTWIALSSNPNSATIANATADTTAIKGFDVPGVYGFIWSVSPCTDTLFVTVLAKPDAGTDQTLCQYSTTVLAGTGTGLWTAAASNPAALTFVDNTSPTTAVSGFTAAGTYTLYWSLNGCSDTMLIHVTAKPSAGPDQTICQYSSTAMTGTGTGTWTADASNPAVVIFVNASSPTTIVNGFTASGTYILYWSLNGCSDTVLINVTAKPNAGSDQTFCQYSTTVLAGTGTGLWTAAASNPAALTFVNNTSPTTAVSGFTAAGTYTLYWSLNGCSDTMLIHVTAKPSAGPDQTICQYSNTAMTGTGSGTWTADALNPAVVSFVNASSPTTIVNGFTASGTYILYWSLNGCSDTVMINVTAKPNAGPDQTFCQYSTTVLAGTGTGLWTAAANPAALTFVDNTSPTTAVSGFTAAGTYTLYWSLNGCSDTMLIHVTAKPSAGPDQTICQYSNTTMTGTGTGTWTADAGNPAVVIFVNASSPTTIVNGFTASGTYSLYWSLNGCSDTVLINVTAKPNAGADQTLCLPGTITTAASAGAGTWSALASNPAASTIVSPNNPVTTISGFTTGGIYSYVWTVNGCSDTMNVTIIPLSPAGPDQTTCQYTTITTAAFGNGAWTILTGNPAPTTIANTSAGITTISGFTVSGTYAYIWLVNGCSDTTYVTVVAKPNAGADQTICQYSTTAMTATGTGTWTADVVNPAVVSFANTTDPLTSVSGFTASGVYTFYWSLNGCNDTVLIQVTAKPNAGADQTICQYSGTALTGTGTGTWTADASNPAVLTFVNTTSPTTIVNGFTAFGIYTLYWSLNGCSDTVLINVTAKPNAGPDQTFCQYSTTVLAGTGTGLWTTSASDPAVLTFVDATSPTTAVSGFTAPGTYTLYWSLNGCSDTMLIHVTAKPGAGADQTICQYSTTAMTGTGAGTWTADASNPAILTFVNASSPTTIVNGFTASGTYTLYWSLNGCSDTVLINVTAKPNAGPDQTICQYSATALSATGTGTWTAEIGNPAVVSFTNNTDPLTSVSGFSAAGVYALYWSLNGCSDTTLVTVTPKPNAGSDQTICQYSGTALGATGAGTWTADAANPAVITFANATSPTSTVSGFTASGIYTLYWSLNGCSDTLVINVTSKPDAGTDQTICQYSGTALAATGTGTWTAAVANPAFITFANPSDPLTSVSGFSAAGTYSLYWSLNGCSDTVLITVTAKPNAGSDQTVCQYANTSLAATGTGTWAADAANPAVISFVSTTDPMTSVSGFTLAGTYTLYWSLNGCSDTVLINVTAKPNAGPDQNVCQFTTVTMAATGTGIWTALASNPSAAIITTPSSANSTITALNAVGTYTFVWTVNGCADSVNVVVNTQPTVTLRDTAICLNKNATLVPTVVPTGGTYLWSTTETTPTITVSPTVSTGFTVTYTLGICVATAADTVTIDPLPVATVSTIASVCTANNGLAIANPGAGTPGYTYSWSNPGGTGDTLSNLAPGSYQVTVTDINHCTTTASGTVLLQTPAITITELSQHNLKCFNDSTGSISISVADTARSGSGYIFVYGWSDNTFNQNLSHSPAGNYTVTVSDQFGCTGQASYTITQPAAITGITSFANPQCFGYSNGTANISSLSGGSGAYHFAWSTNPVQNTSSISGLTAGLYTVSVTDDSLCQVSYTVTLSDPLPITFGTSIITNPTCAGDSNGQAQVVPLNGIGTYTYTWSNGQSTNPATGLYPGTFSVRVTDANGCTATTSLTLTPLTRLDVTLSQTNVLCYGTNTGSVTANTTGGTAPYNYLWNTHANTPTISNLPIGTYSVSATDNNGCTASNSTSLTQPTQLTETLSAVRTNCPSTLDGTIYDTASGGTGSVTFTLEDTAGNALQTGNTTGTFTGLGYGPYIVIATDQNNCPVSETVNVPRAPFNYYTDSIVGTSCYGSQYRDGILHLQGYAIPNGPFLYSVDNSPFQSIPDFFDLAAGPHTVTAQDHYGCDTSFTIIVPEPLPAVLQILPGDSTITAGSTLQLGTDFSPYATSAITSYAWTPVTGLSCIDCPEPVASPFDNITTYTLVVTYNKGCTVTASIQINANGTPPIYVPNGFTPNGDGVNDEWLVFGTGIKDIKATIYDRWGEKIFESDDQSQGWDGTYRGQAQPPGVYVYLVDVVYLSGEKITKRGSLTLIR